MQMRKDKAFLLLQADFHFLYFLFVTRRNKAEAAMQPVLEDR